MTGFFNVDVKASVNDGDLGLFALGAGLFALFDRLSRDSREFLMLGSPNPLRSVAGYIVDSGCGILHI